jgi:hypothetical protein
MKAKWIKENGITRIKALLTEISQVSTQVLGSSPGSPFYKKYYFNYTETKHSMNLNPFNKGFYWI